MEFNVNNNTNMNTDTNMNIKSNTKNIYIFNKYIKKNSKLIPFNLKNLAAGNTKYFPPVSKEWKNSIYVFNHNNIKNLPVYDMNINSLIKDYFNLHFNNKFLFNKYRPRRYRHLSLNKIFVSKAEIKHTNAKAILTVYVYNREKISLLKKIKNLEESFYNKLKLWISINSQLGGIKYYTGSSKKLVWYIKYTKALLHKELILLRKYKLRLNLNKYKFEEKLLYRLSNLMIKYYNKKVIFNIVNMKSIILNSDLFTKILTLKINDKNANIIKMMDTILNKAVLPKVNRIIEKSATVKTIDFNLLENKFKKLNISSILNSNNLSELLNKIYFNVKGYTLNINFKKDYIKIYKIIFDSINYKNMGGVRLEVKGRLTKRYRADRSVFKVKWKGGLKNIDSSYKGLSSVNMRGYIKPNVEYSIFTSKRRIGAFAVKGWISGK